MGQKFCQKQGRRVVGEFKFNSKGIFSAKWLIAEWRPGGTLKRARRLNAGVLAVAQPSPAGTVDVFVSAVPAGLGVFFRLVPILGCSFGAENFSRKSGWREIASGLWENQTASDG
jgi:hypothetical protein